MQVKMVLLVVILLQNEQPVAFCSRSLSETETHYPQIDKELLAICLTLNKFRNYIYGGKFKIKTDHLPLISVCNKDFSQSRGRHTLFWWRSC